MPEEWISSKTRRTNSSRGAVCSGAPASTLVSMFSLTCLAWYDLTRFEDVLELDHAEARDLLLLGKPGKLLVAAVHRLDLGECQVLDVLADVRDTPGRPGMPDRCPGTSAS